MLFEISTETTLKVEFWKPMATAPVFPLLVRVDKLWPELCSKRAVAMFTFWQLKMSKTASVKYLK